MLSFSAQLLLSVQLALTAYCSPVRLAERALVFNNVSALRDEYDYVIIGGGTSGLTVANRLTEDPKSKHLCFSSSIRACSC